MESLEISAKTVDEAVEKALERLNARLSEVEIVVLSEGRAGILGLGAEDAKIRVTKLDSNQTGRTRISGANFPPRPPAISYANNPGAPQDEDDYEDEELGPTQHEPGATDRNAPRQPDRRPMGGGAPAGGRNDRGGRGAPGGSGGGRPAGGPGRGGPQGQNRGPGGDRRDRNDRGRGGDRDRSGGGRGQAPQQPRRAPRELTPPPPPSSPLAAQAAGIIQEMVNRLGLHAVVAETKPPIEDPTNTTPILAFDIQGDDLGSLIGRRGQTLSSLQYLVNLIMRHQSKESLMVVVDVEGYRARRYQTLQNLAHRMADRVRSSGQAVTLEPMTAAERRIIHMTLKDYGDLGTQSNGEGENRKVTIVPKKK